MKRIATLLCLCALSFSLLQLPKLAFAGDDHGIIGKGADSLPLFDAHMHYNRPAWSPFPPDAVLSLMDENGVAMALVSSSPDEGSISLLEFSPRRIVAEMRPYNEHADSSTWTAWEGVGDYIERRLKKHSHDGIGEIHLHRIDPRDAPLMNRIVTLARERMIVLHVHSDRQPIEYLFGLNPDLTIIWAHAGMTEPAAVVEEMMARYPSLYADTSYRETDILTHGGKIDAQWRGVLERFADRFMVGSDTWINTQWEDYQGLIALNRKWLAQLTTVSARKIAYQNAERVFARKVGQHLFGKR